MRASTWLVLEPHRSRYGFDEFKIVNALQRQPKDKPAVHVTLELPDNAFSFEAEVKVEIPPNTWVIKAGDYSEVQSTPTADETVNSDG